MDFICYKSGKIIQCELQQIPGKDLYLEKNCLISYLNMKESAKKDGIMFQEDTAWRSMEYQKQLYADWKAGKLKVPAVAVPGYSNHQNGVCVDLSTGGLGRKSLVYRWLSANAEKFNFYNTVTAEPWHWEYIPKTTMKETK
jgi:LAS superfamily LD-carboxypeptidase LdcB